MLISLPLACYFCLYSPESIRFLAGNGYNGAIMAMRIITLSIVPIGLTGILGVQVLTAIEKEKYVLYSVIVGALVDFLMNLLLIPNMGAAGAALATLIAEVSVLVIQIFYTKNLIVKIFDKLSGHIYLLITLLASGICFFIKFVKFRSNFIILMVSSIIFWGVYGMGLIWSKDALMVKVCGDLISKIRKYKTK